MTASPCRWMTRLWSQQRFVWVVGRNAGLQFAERLDKTTIERLAPKQARPGAAMTRRVSIAIAATSWATPQCAFTLEHPAWAYRAALGEWKQCRNVAQDWPGRRLRSTGTKLRKWPIARARRGGNAELGTRVAARRPRAREYGKSP